MPEDTARPADEVPAAAHPSGPGRAPDWAPPTPPGLPPPSVAMPTTAGSDSTDEPAPRWWRRTTAGLPLAAWLVIGVLAIGGIVVGALALGGDDGQPTLAIDVADLSVPERPDPVPDSAPGTNAPGSSDPVPTVGSTVGGTIGTAPDTAPATAPGNSPVTVPDSAPGTGPRSTPGTGPDRPPVGDGSGPTEPLPTGDPNVSRFTYVDPFGSGWRGTIAGVVEVPLLGDEPGARCFAVVGTLTPETVAGIVSDAWSTPYVTLFVDGEEADLGDAGCATDELTAAGYRSMFDANVTLGTDYAFYTEFSLPESLGEPQAVAVSRGDDGSSDDPSADNPPQADGEWLFFDATLLDEVAPIEVGAVGPLPVDPIPVSDGAPGAFAHADDFSGDEWTGSIVGLVEVPTYDDADRLPGRCFAVVGTLTADSAGSGALTSPYTAPPISVISDGRLIDDYYGCSTADAERAGYRFFYDAAITPGTSIAVYATLIVPQPLPGDVQAILIGDPWGDAPAVLAAHELSGFAPVVATPGPPPGGEPAATGVQFPLAQDMDDASWDVVVHGLAPTDPGSSDEPGDCVVVYTSFTLDVGSSDPRPPELFLVAGGNLLTEDFGCGTAAAREAGYVEQWSQIGRLGQPIHVYAAFRIPPELGPPQAVVVGRGGQGDQVMVAPTELDAIPPIPG